MRRAIRLILSEFEADMALLHDAGAGKESDAAGEEDRLWVAVAEGLETAQPAGEDRRNAVKGQLGVDLEHVFGLARRKMFLSI